MNEWAYLANLGGTAEVTKLLSLSKRIKAFFVTKNQHAELDMANAIKGIMSYPA